MPFIEIIHNEKEYHLEQYNESTLKELGIDYTFASNDKDLVLYSLGEILSIIGVD